MRILITFVLALASLLSAAQPVVIGSREAESQGLTKKLQEYKFPGDVTETPYSTQLAIQSAYYKILDKEKLHNLGIVSQLYLNQHGKIDYLLYNFSDARMGPEAKLPLNLDSLKQIVSGQLAPFISDFVSKRGIGHKSMLRVFVFSGMTMTPTRSKKDSVITNLEDVLTNRDSLKIKTINLERSLLTAIPEAIYRFPNLEKLLLAHNDIEEVNLDLSRLPKLQQLDLDGNILTQDKVHLSKNKSIKLLNLQNNMLTDVPDVVPNCKKLESVWLGRNNMSGLSNKSFTKLKRIKDLNLYKAEITVLPKGVRRMRKIQVLDLYHNKLEVLPQSVTRLKRLTHLAVSHNQLTALPSKIDKMKNVQIIYAHHNRMSKLPERIGKMKNLRILDLGFNWFTNFPPELVAFGNLSELDLSSNNFPEFPEQLLKIKQLDKLYIRGNPFLQADSEKKYGQQLGLLKSKNIEVFY
ncbi:leucine-rich repeat domain-containing protein [Dyadobacter bucti]|uniref:leucine-rich repeat domain-containing protein n=1 Tax=Dyadobacter bucti TaxID=2572203 RepID=UPI0011091CE2|nr:leucine-rich repeat domain-containing protein [Dyadobacter bucti]